MPRIIRVGESLFESGSGYLIAVQGNEWKSRNWPLFFHSCKHLQHCRQSRIEGIEISLREKTKIDSIGTTPCIDYSKTCPIFIPRKRNTSNYRPPPPSPFFFFYSCFQDCRQIELYISRSKTASNNRIKSFESLSRKHESQQSLSLKTTRVIDLAYLLPPVHPLVKPIRYLFRGR